MSEGAKKIRTKTGISPASVITTVTSSGRETSYKSERGERLSGGVGIPGRRERGEAGSEAWVNKCQQEACSASRHRGKEPTHLVSDDTVQHNALTELVRLAAAYDRYSPRCEHHGHHRRSSAREHRSIRE